MRDKAPYRKTKRSLSIRAIAPNAVTLMAFASGLTSIRFALAEKWELAVAAIIIAGVFDGLDGAVARLLKSTSRFGAELDSLSDVVVFGVAPAMIIYLWTLQSLDRLGWAIALVYAMAMTLRLARFNARLEDEDEPRKKLGYLTGVPAPMAAGLSLAPLALGFTFGESMFREYPEIVGLYMTFIAVLMISTVPTPTLKAFKVERESFVPVIFVIGIFLASLFVYTWYVLCAIPVIYLISLPFTYLGYKRKLKALS